MNLKKTAVAFVCFILMFFGAFYISLTAHELFHVWVHKESTSLCYDFGTDAAAHVTHKPDKGLKYEEVYAYSIQLGLLLGLSMLSFVAYNYAFNKRMER